MPVHPFVDAKILIVDDQDFNVAVLENLLEREGYRNLRSTTDSRQVIELYTSFHPDLILLDLMMPHYDGFTIMEQLQAQLPAGEYFPILVLTADITAEAKQRALASGAKDFLTKPLDMMEVALRVRNLLETRLLYRQLQDQNQHLEQQVLERTTALTLANRELSRAEQKYRTLVEHLPVVTYILEFDGVNRTTYISPQVETMLGFTPAEWLADPSLWNRQVHPHDRARVERDILRADRARQTVDLEYRMLARDGREIWLNGQSVPVHDSEGKPRYAHGILVNITERKQRERELEAIATMSAALRTASTRAEMLPIIVEQLSALLQAEAATLNTVDSNNGQWVVEIGQGAWAGLTNVQFQLDEVITGYGPARQVYHNNDVQHDPRLHERARFSALQAIAGIPLTAQQQTIGVLWVGRTTPFLSADIRLLTAVADIAANALYRVALYEQTQQGLQRLKALHSIDQTINASIDPHISLNILLEHTLEQLGVDTATVFSLNPHLHQLELAAARGQHARALQYTQLRLGRGLASQVVLARQALHLPHLASAPPDLAQPFLLKADSFRAYYGVPLIAKGQVKGVLELFHRTPLDPDPEWLDFLEALAGQAALAIDNAELFHSLQSSNTELALAYDTTLEGWSRAMDMRDKETEGHTQRVTDMTVRLAQALGLNELETMNARRGALLHDMGKLGIPDSILLKPDKLTEDEWVVMKQHPTYAYEMLAPIAYLRPALDIPYCHHEKWDGTGYPRGLKGEQIPLAARVFAVADVWDALRSDRPYRKGWPDEKVHAYIHEQIGRHFDPQVVDAFERVIANQETLASSPAPSETG